MYDALRKQHAWHFVAKSVADYPLDAAETTNLEKLVTDIIHQHRDPAWTLSNYASKRAGRHWLLSHTDSTTGHFRSIRITVARYRKPRNDRDYGPYNITMHYQRAGSGVNKDESSRKTDIAYTDLQPTFERMLVKKIAKAMVPV